MRIIHARVFPMDAPVIEDGYVDMRDGRIAAMRTHGGQAAGRVRGAGRRRRLASSRAVDAHSHIGMWEDGLGFEGDDGNEDTDPSTPSSGRSTRSTHRTAASGKRWRRG